VATRAVAAWVAAAVPMAVGAQTVGVPPLEGTAMGMVALEVG